MTTIVLFHSILGMREGVADAVRRMEAAGHTVYAPNLYGPDVVFDDYEEASAYLKSIGGFEELIKRTEAAVADLPTDVVYAGFSNGGGSAQYLVQSRPGAVGAVFFHAGMSPEVFEGYGSDDLLLTWPGSVPVQVHYDANDPFIEPEMTEGLREAAAVSGASFEYFEYPGSGHLFTDPSLPEEYSAESTELLWDRVLSFLDKLPQS